MLIIDLIKRDKFFNCPLRYPWLNQISYIKWPCLVKLAILVFKLPNIFIMPSKLPTYLFIYLPSTYLSPTYLIFTKIIYLIIYLPIYQCIYILTIYQSYLFIY
jgi:hypothetical protein